MPLLMAIKGQIYDVTYIRKLYGPGGAYALFVGKDASRALAKMSLEEKDVNGDLTGLSVYELEGLQYWEYKFMSKYPKFGTIKKPEPASKPSTVEPVEPTVFVPANHGSQPKEDGPSETTAGVTKEETTSEAKKEE